MAAAKGYKPILTMPESFSIEQCKMLALLGARLVLTGAAKGMKGAIEKAQSIVATAPGAISPRQFDNPANPDVSSPHDGPGSLERHGWKGRRSGGPLSSCRRSNHFSNDALGAREGGLSGAGVPLSQQGLGDIPAWVVSSADCDAEIRSLAKKPLVRCWFGCFVRKINQ
ncbi:MAG: hypothetical protein WDM91_06550 [Rhizomicrobium sp.]